jgi:hypothetical protein
MGTTDLSLKPAKGESMADTSVTQPTDLASTAPRDGGDPPKTEDPKLGLPVLAEDEEGDEAESQ